MELGKSENLIQDVETSVYIEREWNGWSS